jgi:hypothetical protein
LGKEKEDFLEKTRKRLSLTNFSANGLKTGKMNTYPRKQSGK